MSGEITSWQLTFIIRQHLCLNMKKVKLSHSLCDKKWRKWLFIKELWVCKTFWTSRRNCIRHFLLWICDFFFGALTCQNSALLTFMSNWPITISVLNTLSTSFGHQPIAKLWQWKRLPRWCHQAIWCHTCFYGFNGKSEKIKIKKELNATRHHIFWFYTILDQKITPLN